MLMSDQPAAFVLLCLSYERTDGDSQISLVRSGNLHGRQCTATGTVGTESFRNSFSQVYWICTWNKKKSKNKTNAAQWKHFWNITNTEGNTVHLWRDELVFSFIRGPQTFLNMIKKGIYNRGGFSLANISRSRILANSKLKCLECVLIFHLYPGGIQRFKK